MKPSGLRKQEKSRRPQNNSRRNVTGSKHIIQSFHYMALRESGAKR